MGANGKTEAAELVRRCQAVGWQVARGGNGHYKVDTRRGTFMIPSTPGDVRSVQNSLSEAKRYGLEKLEAALREQTERDRQDRLLTDRTANDAKLAKLKAAYDTNDGVKAEVKAITESLGSVNGVVIAAIAPAKVTTPRGGAKLSILKDAEELLLVNDEVLYRCLRYVNGAICHQTFANPKSLQVHIGRHTRVENNEDKVKEVITERKPKIAVTAATAATAGTTEQLKVELTRGLTSLVQAIDKIGAGSIEARNAALKLVELVQDLKTEVIVHEPDPELVAKAAQFDALAATLGSLINPTK